MKVLLTIVLSVVLGECRSAPLHTDTLPARQYLNIDYMTRGFFYAYSSPGKEAALPGGWAVSDNIPKKIHDNNRFPPNALSVIVDTGENAVFERKYYGHTVYITNREADTAVFDAQDSRLYMKVQALNSDGKWLDIDYLPASRCGNSYHTVALQPDHYWSFVMPAYHGEMETSIRLLLSFPGDRGTKENKMIFSNIIRGGINPGQFSNKREYTPNGIMDPYTK